MSGYCVLSHSSCNLFYRDHILFYYVSNLFIRQVTCKINDCKTLQCSFNSIQILRIIFISIFSLFVCLMVFNATFNNISVISWQSVLLMEETAEDQEKTTDHGSCILNI
jgi:hypothetical protein